MAQLINRFKTRLEEQQEGQLSTPVRLCPDECTVIHVCCWGQCGGMCLLLCVLIGRVFWSPGLARLLLSSVAAAVAASFPKTLNEPMGGVCVSVGLCGCHTFLHDFSKISYYGADEHFSPTGTFLQPFQPNSWLLSGLSVFNFMM